MSIVSLLNKSCKQVAVYWGNPVNDGEGGFTFDAPIEILCRWEDKNEIFLSSNGNEEVSKSVVYVLQDLNQEGYLYLGFLDDLLENVDSAGELNPKEVSGAQAIRRFDKLATFGSTTDFLRKVYLTSKNMV
jgi:hypothetical protein